MRDIKQHCHFILEIESLASSFTLARKGDNLNRVCILHCFLNRFINFGSREWWYVLNARMLAQVH
jgi:hypothetical protein